MGGRDWTRVLNLGLGALVLLLAVVLARGAGDWFSAPSETSPARQKQPHQATPGQRGQAGGKRGDLFAPTGRVSPVAVPEMGITILGVVLDGDDSFVLARTSGRGSAVHKLYPGSRLGPYRLEEIGPETVVFSGGSRGRRREIRWRRFSETAGDEPPRPRRTLDDISRIPGGSVGKPPRPPRPAPSPRP